MGNPRYTPDASVFCRISTILQDTLRTFVNIIEILDGKTGRLVGFLKKDNLSASSRTCLTSKVGDQLVAMKTKQTGGGVGPIIEEQLDTLFSPGKVLRPGQDFIFVSNSINKQSEPVDVPGRVRDLLSDSRCNAGALNKK